MSTARQPQASVLTSGDYGGEKALRQPGGPAAHGSLRAWNQISVHLSVRQKEDRVAYERHHTIIENGCNDQWITQRP